MSLNAQGSLLSLHDVSAKVRCEAYMMLAEGRCAVLNLHGACRMLRCDAKLAHVLAECQGRGAKLA